MSDVIETKEISSEDPQLILGKDSGLNDDRLNILATLLVNFPDMKLSRKTANKKLSHYSLYLYDGSNIYDRSRDSSKLLDIIVDKIKRSNPKFFDTAIQPCVITSPDYIKSKGLTYRKSLWIFNNKAKPLDKFELQELAKALPPKTTVTGHKRLYSDVAVARGFNLTVKGQGIRLGNFSTKTATIAEYLEAFENHQNSVPASQSAAVSKPQRR